MNNQLVLGVLLLPFLTSCSYLGGLDKADSTGNNNTSASTASCHPSKIYKANGKRYRVLNNVTGYQANGMAEVYVNKVHGSQTAGCESFDMNGFTAAHRTLPLPTHVKITHKGNGQAIVIKVNDRGPAMGNSVIQVTPAIANLLGASTDTSFPVHIEALTHATLPVAYKPTSLSKLERTVHSKKSSTHSSKTQRVIRKPVNRSHADRYYIVVGTYPSRNEAFDRFVRVSSIGLSNAAMESRTLKGQVLHMVRLGPYYDQDEIDATKDRLRNDGLVKFNVVKN